jgi:ATP-binding cassette, subfamily C, bacterial CydD
VAKTLLRQLPGVRRWVAFSVGLGLLGTLLLIAQTALLASVIARAFQAHAALPALAPALVALLILTVMRAGVTWLRETAAQAGAGDVKRALRAGVIAHLLHLGPLALREQRTGELVATVGDGIDRLDPYVARYLPQRLLSVLTPLVIGVAVLARDWMSALILLATAPILPLLMILVGRYAEGHIRLQWTALSRMSAYLLDTLQGLTTIKMFARGADTRETIRRVGVTYRVRTLAALRYAFLSGLVLDFVTAGAIALLAVDLGTRLLAGAVSFERAFFVLLLAPEFYRPLRELGQHRHAAMEAREPAARIEALPHWSADSMSDASVGPSLMVTRSAHEPPVTLAGPLHIALNGVGYSYPGSAGPSLTGLDLALQPGTRTALVGPSGAGKSTLVGLLLRFIEPTAGTITVNGIPLAALSVEDWRAHTAYVPQRPHLFAAPLHENISLGKPGATRREVACAAAMAGVDQFIERLPLGYDTPIGERGARLSGGEAQRIAIARAFLRDAPLLILDEPTSALDPVTEMVIRSALERLMGDRTVLVVAHRLNTVAGADRIVVLDEGRIVESGAHRELLERDGLYARLVRAPGAAVTV